MMEQKDPAAGLPTPEGVGAGRRGRRAAFDRDWTQGSIVRNVLLLAWPIVVGNVVNQFDMMVDMVWVARLGAKSVAGVGVAGTLLMLLSLFRMGITVGERPMIARFVGADDIVGANKVVLQAFLLNLVYLISAHNVISAH